MNAHRLHNRARLTFTDVCEVRLSSKPLKAIASEKQISIAQVSRIRSGKRWSSWFQVCK